MEGDSVTLNADVTGICEDDVLWNYKDKNSLIAKINREAKTSSIYDGPDGRFRDRLKLDDQTGSLTITNITTEHAGVYQLQISGAKLTSKTFNVTVYVVDDVAVQTHDEEIIYADPTFYKINPQEMTAKEENHVEYATVCIRS
ncbi:hypothetical protein cypCar_00043466 [Cyprinus carpio]|nr:hypothetical protein cypCar_00043466 [Cyprinus carpio]